MHKTSFILIIIALFALTSTSAFAINNTHNKMHGKLKRGAINVVSSPLEVPKQIKTEWDKGGNNIPEKTVWAFSGVFKGLAYMGGRLGSGLWDVVTFNINKPVEYDSLVKPDYVLDSGKDPLAVEPEKE